ncbi:MAG: DUF362 domain-containing protein [Patescibacteria group bacterium]|jgi:uncharacterized protein (DUF362 family)
MVKLSYIHSKDSAYNIERSLSLIKTEVTKSIKNKSRVVVMVDIPRPSSKQVIEASVLEALLNFLTPHVKGQITVTGQAEKGKTLDIFKDLGYLKFQDQYDFAASDLNEEEQVLIKAGENELSVPKILHESDFIVLLATPKITDGKFAGALANLIPAESSHAPSFLERIFGAKEHNSNLSSPELIVETFKQYKVSLSVIDGHRTVVSSSGNEDILPTNFAISSINTVEADVLTAMCLGIQPEDVDYLSLFDPDLGTVFVVGDDWNKYSLSQQ